jgi:hypothetical protein
VRVRIDDRAVGARAVVGALRYVTADKNRNGPEEMVRILLVNHSLDREFPFWSAMCPFQADADSPDALFQKRTSCIHDSGLVRIALEPEDVVGVQKPAQDGALGFATVQISLIPARHQKPDTWASQLSQHV